MSLIRDLALRSYQLDPEFRFDMAGLNELNLIGRSEVQRRSGLADEPVTPEIIPVGEGNPQPPELTAPNVMAPGLQEPSVEIPDQLLPAGEYGLPSLSGGNTATNQLREYRQTIIPEPPRPLPETSLFGRGAQPVGEISQYDSLQPATPQYTWWQNILTTLGLTFNLPAAIGADLGRFGGWLADIGSAPTPDWVNYLPGGPAGYNLGRALLGDQRVTERARTYSEATAQGLPANGYWGQGPMRAIFGDSDDVPNIARALAGADFSFASETYTAQGGFNPFGLLPPEGSFRRADQIPDTEFNAQIRDGNAWLNGLTSVVGEPLERLLNLGATEETRIELPRASDWLTDRLNQIVQEPDIAGRVWLGTLFDVVLSPLDIGADINRFFRSRVDDVPDIAPVSRPALPPGRPLGLPGSQQSQALPGGYVGQPSLTADPTFYSPGTPPRAALPAGPELPPVQQELFPFAPTGQRAEEIIDLPAPPDPRVQQLNIFDFPPPPEQLEFDFASLPPRMPRERLPAGPLRGRQLRIPGLRYRNRRRYQPPEEYQAPPLPDQQLTLGEGDPLQLELRYEYDYPLYLPAPEGLQFELPLGVESDSPVAPPEPRIPQNYYDPATRQLGLFDNPIPPVRPEPPTPPVSPLTPAGPTVAPEPTVPPVAPTTTSPIAPIPPRAPTLPGTGPGRIRNPFLRERRPNLELYDSFRRIVPDVLRLTATWQRTPEQIAASLGQVLSRPPEEILAGVRSILEYHSVPRIGTPEFEEWRRNYKPEPFEAQIIESSEVLPPATPETADIPFETPPNPLTSQTPEILRLVARWGQSADDIARTYADVTRRPFQEVLEDVQDIMRRSGVPEDADARRAWERRYQQEELIESIGAEANQVIETINEIIDEDAYLPVGLSDDMPFMDDMPNPDVSEMDEFIRRQAEAGSTPQDIAAAIAPQVPAEVQRYIEPAVTRTVDPRTRLLDIARSLESDSGQVVISELWNAVRSSMSRDEFERIVKQLTDERRVVPMRLDDPQMVTPEMEAGGVDFGGETRHILMIKDDSVYRGTRRETPIDPARDVLDSTPEQARSRARGIVENPMSDDVMGAPRVERYERVDETMLEDYRIDTPQIGDTVGMMRGGRFVVGEVIRQTATGFSVRDATGKMHTRIRDFYNPQYATDLANSLRLAGVEFPPDSANAVEAAIETFNANPTPRNGSRVVNESVQRLQQRYENLADQFMDEARQFLDEDEYSYAPVPEPVVRPSLDQFIQERRYQEQLRRFDQARDARYVYPERVTVHQTQRADWRRYTQMMRDALRLKDPQLLVTATMSIIESHPRTLRQRAIDVYNRYRELYRELNAGEWVPEDILPNIEEVCD